jgi:allantoate deiminase
MATVPTELAERVIARCRELAQFTEEPGHITRTYLSPPMHDVHARLKEWMEPAGLTVTVDAVGNLRGHYPGRDGRVPRLLIGSHLDTVPHAGCFDGILGVVLALALVESLNGDRLTPAIEVIGFSEEEGIRYGVPFIGSRAVVGKMDDELLSKISGAIYDFGLDPSRVPEAALDSVSGYLEMHIEQGPVLESLGQPLGVVEAIAGQSRLTLQFQGRSNHAGTTPMNLRNDALTAAAEWIGVVEKEARGSVGLVATVGKLGVQPGASNIIPGVVLASLDVRHADDMIRRCAVSRMLSAAKKLAEKRGVGVSWETHMEQDAVAMDQALTSILARAVESAGFGVNWMSSGAGHDAMILAQRFPSALLFLRSPGGVSHHPDEAVLVEDVAAALAAGTQFLKHWEPTPYATSRIHS